MRESTQPTGGLVYFQQHHEKPWVRIGHTGVDNGRERNQPDFELIGLRPGFEEDEKRLHGYFRPHLVGRDQSTYSGEEIENYVLWLTDMGMLVQTRQEATQLPDAPLEAWHPQLMQFDIKGNPTLFTSRPLGERIEAVRNDLVHLSSSSDEWETPIDMLERARRTMGSIDTDPASNPHAQQNVQAAIWYHRSRSGLAPQHPWWGNVWLNPPYGTLAKSFVERLIKELESGSVTQAITCLNINSVSALWFQTVWNSATAHAISVGRPNFVNMSRSHSSPSKGIILSYFGDNPERFNKEFANWRLVGVLC